MTRVCGQVGAIVNLVAASVPGMSPDAVRVVAQNGRLLSDPQSREGEGLTLQRENARAILRRTADLTNHLASLNAAASLRSPP